MYRAWGLFGSSLKEKVVQWLYLRDDRSLVSSAYLAKEIGVTPKTLYRPLQQLVRDQLVVREETPMGSGYRAPFEDPRLMPLFGFLRQDSEIVARLKRALKPFKPIEYAGIFGAFADFRTSGSRDIDVLLVYRDELEDPELYHLNGALAHAADKIGREIRDQRYSLEELRTRIREGDGYALGIITGPRIALKGTLDFTDRPSEAVTLG